MNHLHILHGIQAAECGPLNSIDTLGMSCNAPKTDSFRFIILLFPVCLDWIYLSGGQV